MIGFPSWFQTNTPAKSLMTRQLNIAKHDWFVTFEDTVAYMNNFFLCIKEQCMFIEMNLSPDREMLDFKTFICTLSQTT